MSSAAAIGTAAGDLTAYSLHLGFWESAVLFAVIIAIPALGWARGRLDPVLAFWFAYVVTRPLGASFADGFSKPAGGGLGMGDGTVSLIALAVFAALVAWVTVTRHGVQRSAPAHRHHAHLPHPHLPDTGAPEPQVAEN